MKQFLNQWLSHLDYNAPEFYLAYVNDLDHSEKRALKRLDEALELICVTDWIRRQYLTCSAEWRDKILKLIAAGLDADLISIG